MTGELHTIVIGGGIAGVSALAALSRHGTTLLLERESSLCAHASGRNAAIFRPLEHDQTTAALARRSLELLSEITREPILNPVGLLLAASDRGLVEAAAEHARANAVAHAVLDQPQCVERVTWLSQGDVSCALWLPEAGVLDIHAMTTALAGVARDRGGQVRYGAHVVEVTTAAGRVTGVRLADGQSIRAARVVVAGGAWASEIGATCGSRIRLQPVRRHLIWLRPPHPIAAQDPVVWRIDPDAELYFRPESGGLLASPCDAVPMAAGPLVVDRAALEALALGLQRTAPALARAEIHHAWACLRTFAADCELVVGADPDVNGLYWLAGLGGRGMAVAAAAGELLGTLVATGRDDSGSVISPARL